MLKPVSKRLVGVLALLFSTSGFSATITVITSTTNPTPGSTFSLTVHGDGFPSTAGGTFGLMWSTAAVNVTSVVLAVGSPFTGGVVAAAPWNPISVLGPLVGTLPSGSFNAFVINFQVLANAIPGTPASIVLVEDSSDLCWSDAVTFGCVTPVTYTQANVTIGPWLPPDAKDDTASTPIATPLPVAVLANDQYFTAPVTVTVLSGPAHGNAVVSGSPGNSATVRITYTANLGFIGTDSFVYQASSGAGSDTATVTITVTGPTAVDDQATTYEGFPVDIDVLANDTGFASPLTADVFLLPGHGVASVTGSPGDPAGIRFHYDPNPGFRGTDAFQYAVDDGAHVGIATVSITVAEPAAGNDERETPVNTPVTLAPGANDLGFADPVSIFITSGAANGSVFISGSPGARDAVTATYTPNAGFGGYDSFSYQISDGVRSDTATVTVLVRAGAFPDQATTERGQAVDVPVLANDVGFAAPVTVSLGTLPAHGNASVNGSPGNAAGVFVRYTPTAGFSGLDSFTYAVDDGLTTASAQVTVIVRPQAVNDSVVTLAGAPVTIPIFANDLGFGSPVTATIIGVPLHGQVSVLGSPGNPGSVSVTYTPDPGFVGTDSFQYAGEDALALDTATVTVRVATDVDGDGVFDFADNCSASVNANQRDTDGDGYGNICDADLNNNGFVNFADLAIFRQAFGSANPDADFNGNGIVNFADLATFRQLFGKAPGPSALHPVTTQALRSSASAVRSGGPRSKAQRNTVRRFQH